MPNQRKRRAPWVSRPTAAATSARRPREWSASEPGRPSAGGRRTIGRARPVFRRGLSGLSVLRRPAHHQAGSRTMHRCRLKLVRRKQGTCKCIGAAAPYASRPEKNELPGAFSEERSCSLALRRSAAPGTEVHPGTGFARAAGAELLKHRVGSKCGLPLASHVVVKAPWPNPSVEGTSTMQLRCIAAAPHLKRWASQSRKTTA